MRNCITASSSYNESLIRASIAPRLTRSRSLHRCGVVPSRQGAQAGDELSDRTAALRVSVRAALVGAAQPPTRQPSGDRSAGRGGPVQGQGRGHHRQHETGQDRAGQGGEQVGRERGCSSELCRCLLQPAPLVLGQPLAGRRRRVPARAALRAAELKCITRLTDQIATSL